MLSTLNSIIYFFIYLSTYVKSFKQVADEIIELDLANPQMTLLVRFVAVEEAGPCLLH
jgi:hypothetical protein